MKNITKKKNFCRSIRHLVDDRDSRNHAVAVALTVTFDRQLAPLLYNQFNQVPYTIIKINELSEKGQAGQICIPHCGARVEEKTSENKRRKLNDTGKTKQKHTVH